MPALLSSLLLSTLLEQQGGAGEDSFMLIDTQYWLVPTRSADCQTSPQGHALYSMHMIHSESEIDCKHCCSVRYHVGVGCADRTMSFLPAASLSTFFHHVVKFCWKIWLNFCSLQPVKPSLQMGIHSDKLVPGDLLVSLFLQLHIYTSQISGSHGTLNYGSTLDACLS